ncbi:hypothetical protein CUS_6933 [Ruminococcus albus 8]|uniref:Uncharacterized protein n=1 Tax=Ruminococcus albus 8 TaxID=246199 RepID=E9SHJ8_RUMAL|nr:hypothetical protein CUS_6933 [Ruminococcus albus 8]
MLCTCGDFSFFFLSIAIFDISFQTYIFSEIFLSCLYYNTLTVRLYGLQVIFSIFASLRTKSCTYFNY